MASILSKLVMNHGQGKDGGADDGADDGAHGGPASEQGGEESSDEFSDESSDDDNKEKANSKNDDYVDYLESYLNQNKYDNKYSDNKTGFVLNEIFLRTIIDGIKCRSNIDRLIDFNFGPNNIFEINKSQLILLLLEISQESNHKKIISSAIEQRIPIPVLYAMGQVRTVATQTSAQVALQLEVITPGAEIKEKEKEKEVKQDANNSIINVKPQFYVRDILHLASQGKIICDNMNQSDIGHNLPLVMFIGSNNVKYKSTLLTQIYGKLFNIVEYNRTPLHSTSVDLIYLPKYCKTNYHILDVHGQIDNPFFRYCTNDGMSRIEALVKLAQICHCVVLQIDSSELSTKFVKKCKKGKKMESFDMNNLIKSKGKATVRKGQEMIDFYNVRCCCCYVMFCVLSM